MAHFSLHVLISRAPPQTPRRRHAKNQRKLRRGWAARRQGNNVCPAGTLSLSPLHALRSLTEQLMNTIFFDSAVIGRAIEQSYRTHRAQQEPRTFARVKTGDRHKLCGHSFPLSKASESSRLVMCRKQISMCILCRTDSVQCGKDHQRQPLADSSALIFPCAMPVQ